MNIERLAAELKGFEGVKRKSGIGLIEEVLELDKLGKKFFVGDDTAVIKLGKMTLLFSCDSINENLVEAYPFFAGYSAVLVNVNDIAAMGGRPIAMVDVLSARDKETALKIVRGVKEASFKFGVPIVGGHFNPNATYNGIEISIIGEAKGGNLIKGSTAKPGDMILAAIDLDGRIHPRYGFAWDSTSHKSPERVRENLDLLVKLAEMGIVRSGRDISNPGLVGTVGMLLEESKVGGTLNLTKIPRPKGVNILDWLKVYPGYGFVFTADNSGVDETLAMFKNHSISAAVIGEVSKIPKLLIGWKGKEEEVFDFERMSITGV
jgi:putative methanogenesis marker protein 2